MLKNYNVIFVVTGILQIFIGLGAIPAGIGFIIDPYGGNYRIPLELIYDSPFQTYLIPGIFLLTVNGMGSIFGAAFSMTKHHLAGVIAIFLGMAVLIWVLCQIYWIGMITWYQPAYFILGFIELMLGLYLAKKLHEQKKIIYKPRPTR